jgi:hypothetical protein
VILWKVKEEEKEEEKGEEENGRKGKPF